MTQPVPVEPGDTIMLDAEGNRVAVAPGFEREAMAQGLAPEGQQFIRDGNEVRALAGREAAAALAENPFASLTTGQDFAQNEERKQFESIGGRVGSFGIGAGRGLSFGASDWIGSELGGEDYRNYANKAGFYNPNTVLAGEVAGMLAPALVTGGASAEAGLALRGARLATAPARAVFGAAEGLGGLATRGAVGLGAAEGGLLARGAGSLARGAVEGAVFGAGNEISKESLKGEPLDIDKIIASGAHTALIGSALSGGLTLAGAGFSRLRAGRVADGLEATMMRDAGAAEGFVAREAEAAGAAAEVRAAAAGASPEAIALAGQEARTAATTTALARFEEGVAGAGAREGETWGEKAVRYFEAMSGEARSGKGLGEKFGQLSDEFAVKAAGAHRQKMRALYEQGDTAYQRVARMMREEIPAAGKRPLGSLNKEEIAQLGEGLKTKYGEAIDSIVTRAETANGGALDISVPDLAKKIRTELLEPLMKDPSAAAQESWLANWVERLETRGETISWRDLRDLRSGIDKRIVWGQRTHSEQLEMMKDLRRGVEDHLIDAGEWAAKKAGGSFAEEYAAAKSGYAASSWISSAAEEADVRLLTNRGFGFSEQVGGAAFGNMGATAGAALAGPLGGIVGGALGFLGGAYVNHQVRHYGAGLASDFLARAATDRVLLNEVSRLDGVIRNSVKDAVRKTGERLDERAAGGAAKASRFEGEVVDVGEGAAAKAEGAAAKVDGASAEAVEQGATRAETAAAKPAGKAEAAELEAEKAAEETTTAKAEGRLTPGVASAAGEKARESDRRKANVEEQYRRTRQRYAEMVANPKKLDAVVASMVGGRPDLAAGVRAKLLEQAKWLQAQAPKAPASSRTLTPHLADTTPSETQMAEWLRKRDGVENPERVIEQLGEGKATREGLMALRANYPDLHRDIVTQVYDQLGQATQPVPYEKRLQLGMLIGAPTDPTLNPSFMRAAQATYAANPSQSPKKEPPKATKTPDLAKAFAAPGSSFFGK